MTVAAVVAFVFGFLFGCMVICALILSSQITHEQEADQLQIDQEYEQRMRELAK